MVEVNKESIGAAASGELSDLFGNRSLKEWNSIITNVRKLLADYSKMQGRMGGKPTTGQNPPTREIARQTSAELPPDIVTASKLIDLATQVLVNLEGQGKGEESIGKVISETDITVSNAKGLLGMLQARMAGE